MKRGTFRKKSYQEVIEKARQKAQNSPRRKKLRLVGHSTVADQKKEIQRLVREIVIIRDGGCIFRDKVWHNCTGWAKDGHLILQADHLISRSNSATFADTRLIVCVCKGIHGWKSVGANLRKAQYDEMVREILPTDRLKLWERCEKDSWRPTRTGASDWKLAIISLNQELNKLK